jgi:methylmalonyl-CoA mutase
MFYEQKKHDGSLPLIGVNTFLPREHAGEVATEIELIRSTPEEKQQQIANVQTYQLLRNSVSLPCARSAEERAGEGLAFLQSTARRRENLFTALIEAVKTHSLGQISHALYDVGGEYRRNM